jgi:hypothetical protein
MHVLKYIWLPLRASASDVSNWTKVEVLLEANATDHKSRLQLKTSRKGVIWFDQVSAMPLDTYKVCDSLWTHICSLKEVYKCWNCGLCPYIWYVIHLLVNTVTEAWCNYWKIILYISMYSIFLKLKGNPLPQKYIHERVECLILAKRFLV